MNILIAEDDRAAREILRATLSRFGHRLIITADGEEAWTALVSNSVQVIISDWMMPRMDGLQLCRKVRQRRRKDYIYFILLTARTGKEDYHLAMDNGVDDFLTKPLRQDDLIIRLRVAERLLGFVNQVRELKRLLPICTHCKKIRDDQNYWHQVEAYIHSQTGTDFSHSICPDCYQKVLQAASSSAPAE